MSPALRITPHAHAADQPSTAAVATGPAAPIHIDGGYAVGTSQATWDDPAWQGAVQALAAKHTARIIRFKDSIAKARAGSRYAAALLRHRAAARREDARVGRGHLTITPAILVAHHTFDDSTAADRSGSGYDGTVDTPLLIGVSTIFLFISVSRSGR